MLNSEVCCKDIIDNYYEYFFNLNNVNGIGYGYKHINGINTLEPCLHVFVNNKVNKKNLSNNNIIPTKYMGIKTDVIKVTDFKDEIITQNDIILNQKIRPLEGGSEVGFVDNLGAGTICCIVKKKIKRNVYNYYILSNNHVLANFDKNPIGTKFTQPANDENSLNSSSNIVAELETFIPIYPQIFVNDRTPRNSVDCAIARILDNSNISNRIRNIGIIKGTKKAKVGMKVSKFGRTTGLTTGTVDSINVTTFADSNNIGRYYIKNQIYTSIYTKPGDSGSPIVTQDGYIIAMHAGRSGYVSRSSDINIVLDKLKVKLYLG